MSVTPFNPTKGTAVSINEIKGLLRLIPNDLSILILGQPGVGKTHLSEQLAEERGAKYKVFLTSTMDPTDVVGVPHPDGEVTRFLPPVDFMELTQETEYTGDMVACFDDLPAADERVFAALFRMFQQREVAGHKIRDNVLLIGTGNRVQDKAAARELPTALNNRFVHFNLRLSPEEWRTWAVTHGIQPQLVGYIQVNPHCLNTFDPNSPNPAFATPRSIEMASKIQKAVGIDHPDLFTAIAGAVGEGWAGEYIAFLENSEKLIPPDEIFKDPKGARVPAIEDVDILHCTICAIIYAVGEEPTLEHTRAALIYAERLQPKEFTIILARDIVQSIIVKADDMQYRADISACKEFIKMHKKYGKYLSV